VKVPLSFEFIYEQPALNTGNASPQEAGPAANYVILSKELAQKGNQKSKKFLPVYPDLARLARIQGTVIFAATVGKDGAIRELKPMHGHPMLIPAASDAVRRWHYAPYIYHGKPVPFDVRIETSFVLTGN
jgi:TonB family protein